ncbi:MAG: ABC transporter ATP-binding protein [Acidimicrobiales bacterium]
MKVSLSSISVSYDGSSALGDVSIEVDDSGWLGLIGPNGSGKTSLLRAVAGLVDFGGTVAFDGREVSPSHRRRISRLVAYVPQRPVLPAQMTVSEYVLLGRTPHISFFGTESHHDRLVAAEVIGRLELEEFSQRPLASLSGGEVQRAVLARALAQQAPVLLLDEPTAALDIGHGQKVLELVDSLREERDLTVISAMHDLTLAGQFSTRLVLLAKGRLLATGTVREVLSERVLARHYGAELRVLEDGAGGVAVLPRRRVRNRDGAVDST